MTNRIDRDSKPCPDCPIQANCGLTRQTYALVADRLPAEQARVAEASISLVEAALRAVIQSSPSLFLIGPDQDGECCVDDEFQQRMDQLAEDYTSAPGNFAKRELQG